MKKDPGADLRRLSRLGAADVFLEIVMQPFLGFDGIVNWSGFCSAFIVRRLVSPGSYSTRFRPARVSCSPGWRGGVSSPRHETHRNVASSRSPTSRNGLRRQTSPVLYAPSADSAMALS